MTPDSPQVTYDHLSLLDQVDTAESALYREEAQDILGDLDVSLSWRQAIADRLSQANHLLAMRTVNDNDSY